MSYMEWGLISPPPIPEIVSDTWECSYPVSERSLWFQQSGSLSAGREGEREFDLTPHSLTCCSHFPAHCWEVATATVHERGDEGANI